MPTTPLTRDDLLAAYASYGRPRERWLLGGEFERHLLDASGRPMPYDGAPGIRQLLESFVAEGWRPERERGAVIAATRDKASITLEPGGQFELSGAPVRRVADVVAEAAAFSDAVDEKLEGTGYHQVALGYTPYTPVDAIGWVPKGRYAIMREHMLRAGTHGHHMMKATAATQASFDVSTEADTARKMFVSTALAPIVTAMFANSPLVAGRPSGFKTFRGFVWTRTDPDRSGFPDAALDFSQERWVDYLLDVPMMFRKRDGAWLPARGHTFRHWLEHGDDTGRKPTVADWDLHLTSVFPEVRVKRQIEVRMADCVDLDRAGAFVALWKGLFYCELSLTAATAIARRFVRFGTPEARHLIASEHGPQGIVGGHRLAAWAEEVVEAAREGLLRCDPEEVDWLAPLERDVAAGRCPADDVLDAWHADPRPEALMPLLHPRGNRHRTA